ncbi:hypothetical protein CSV61_08545 [Sporosarcina sp. P3]|uniref:hypothetical protein n=1 Tax=Sporosarcina sp. P3 TaxID=2048245 RepID=UPI000C169006|nr:hypothetical protein [Sporosarcina sp. P3]PID21739.1 hypothetical protein CSV61_08545 [Sporosarcina sp. P3]
MPTPPSATKVVTNKAQFDAAVKNTAIKTIKLGDNITGDLTIDRLANLDLNGRTVTGNVVIATQATGTIDISAGTITGNLTVTAPAATINNSATVKGTVTINDVAVGTWNESADFNKFVINDKTGVIFNVKAGKKVAKIEVTAQAAGGAVQINNEGTITELEANTEVSLVNEQGAAVTTVSGTKDVEITGDGAGNVDAGYQALQNAKAKVNALVAAMTDKDLTVESNLIAAENALGEAQTALQAIENNPNTEGLFNETNGREATIQTARATFNATKDLSVAEAAVKAAELTNLELTDTKKVAVESAIKNLAAVNGKSIEVVASEDGKTVILKKANASDVSVTVNPTFVKAIDGAGIARVTTNTDTKVSVNTTLPEGLTIGDLESLSVSLSDDSIVLTTNTLNALGHFLHGTEKDTFDSKFTKKLVEGNVSYWKGIYEGITSADKPVVAEEDWKAGTVIQHPSAGNISAIDTSFIKRTSDLDGMANLESRSAWNQGEYDPTNAPSKVIVKFVRNNDNVTYVATLSGVTR